VQTFPSPNSGIANDFAHWINLQPGDVEDGLNFGNRRANTVPGTTLAAAIPAISPASESTSPIAETAAAPASDSASDLLFARLGQKAPGANGESRDTIRAFRAPKREDLAASAIDAVLAEVGVLDLF
jgi:hypothetical protein